MIINLNQFGGGGGGSYVLPVATSEVLGGVKVGDFLSINSAGTLSVETTQRIGYVEYGGQVRVDDFITDAFSTFSFIKERDTKSDIELFTIMSYGNRTKAYLKSDNKYYVKRYNDDTLVEITGSTPINIYNATYTFNLSGNNLTVTADINGKDVVDLYSGTVSMLPIATTGSTGMVKIGEGINVDSAGTISVEGGGAATIVKSLSEAPTGLTDGDVVIIQKEVKMCKVIDDSGNTLNTGHYVWGDMGEPAYLIVNSNAIEDTLAIQFNYYAYKTYVYTGEDGFRYEVTENDVFSSSGAISSSVNVTMGDYTLYFSLLTANSLSIGLLSNVEFIVHQRVDSDTFVNGGAYYTRTEGEKAAIAEWTDNWHSKKVVLWYGDLPLNTILLKVYTPWGYWLYWSWDGEKLVAWTNDSMTDRNTDWDITKGEGYNTWWMWNFTDGMLTVSIRELGQQPMELVGNWYTYNTTTYEPLDWQDKVDNIDRYFMPLFYSKFNYSVGLLAQGDISVNEVPSGGIAGQVLAKDANSYGWVNLPVEVQVSDTLPTFGSDGSIAIVNTGATTNGSTAFIARNSTSSDDKNNFTDIQEIDWYDWGNNYTYFSNGDYASTAKTFLYRIAMRTNENGDWNTSNLAYINVFREYDSVNQTYFYSWDMPPFDYKDDQGNDFTYSDSGTVDSSTTSANTAYLPIWRWWDGAYGYKFCFEYDTNNGGLKVWMRHCDPDGYPQGESYGDISYEVRNHTTEFYNGMGVSGATSIYTFKGGAWYKLGDLA